MSNFGVRNYDDGLGRFMSIDPLWEKYRAHTPYNYTGNSPLVAKDANGEAWNFVVGAVVGAATDVVFQVMVNVATGKEWHDIDPASVLVSAAAGAIGVGLAAKINKLEKLGKTGVALKETTEATIDATGSLVNQMATGDGEVTATATLIDVTAGRTIGKFIGKTVETQVKNSPKVQQLSKEAGRRRRIANNAKSRKAAKENSAEKIEVKVEVYPVQSSASATVSSTGFFGNLGKKASGEDK